MCRISEATQNSICNLNQQPSPSVTQQHHLDITKEREINNKFCFYMRHDMTPKDSASASKHDS